MVIDKNSLPDFTKKWLTSWTGNKPGTLLDFYSDDAFYLDPANPKGLKGKEQLFTYFKKLLEKNPNWKWIGEEIFPTEKGFTLKWKAEIPVDFEILVIYGLDIVELRNEKISRNEVYFDRHEWIMKIGKK